MKSRATYGELEAIAEERRAARLDGPSERAPSELAGPAKVVAAVPTGSPAGKEAREAALHTHITGIICGVGDEVYPGRCIRAAKKIVALVRKHDRQENIAVSQPGGQS